MAKRVAKSKEDDGPTWPLPPRANPELIGHDAAEEMLADAFGAGTLPHALLICGQRGIGKATLAYRLARYVLSDGGGQGGGGANLFGEAPSDGLALDPDHPVFRRVAAGGHADLKAVTRSLNERGKLRTGIVVDDVRGIGRFMSMTPAEGGWRVVVIDSADEMNVNAANAVLKVLEEPPARALLILVAHSPGRLLPTIRSRCRQLTLRPLAEETVSDLIAHHLREKGDVVPDADRLRLAALADGSIGRALDLYAAGGLALFDGITELMSGMPYLDVPALHAFAGKVGASGADAAYATAIDLFRWWLARLIVDGAAGRTVPEAAGSDAAAALSKLTATADVSRLLDFRDKAEGWIGRTDALNMERRQTVLNLFIGLADALAVPARGAASA